MHVPKNFSKLYVGRLFQIKNYKNILCTQENSDRLCFFSSSENLGKIVTIIDENPKYVKCLTKIGAVWIKRNYLLKEIFGDNQDFYDNSSIVDEAVRTITNVLRTIASNDVQKMQDAAKSLEQLLVLLRKIK
jgi:hypothetical protein